MTMTSRAPSNPLHLLRSLLRECTYLPDHAARNYFHQYILHRFRKCASDDRLALPDGAQKTAHLLRSARRGLSLLQRANSGELKPLQKVLMHTYGRSGKRRRQLIAEVAQYDTPSDQSALERLRNTPTDKVPSAVSSKLMALAKSHQKRPALDLGRAPIRRLSPQIPEKNIWGRKFPACRARNLKRKFYASLLDKIQPPLPRHEWERLSALATGKLKESAWDIAQRRSRPSDEDTSALQKTINWRMGENPFPRKNMIEQPHFLTARFMRRVWAKILLQTPVMTQDPRSKAWSVKWGSLDDGRVHLQRATSPSMLSLFDGVDENGIKPKSPKS